MIYFLKFKKASKFYEQQKVTLIAIYFIYAKLVNP